MEDVGPRRRTVRQPVSEGPTVTYVTQQLYFVGGFYLSLMASSSSLSLLAICIDITTL
jgi:hypothetical protein